jgi:hypothetical protein
VGGLSRDKLLAGELILSFDIRVFLTSILKFSEEDWNVASV